MVHGSQQFFLERARFERRLSLTTALVAVAMLGLMALGGTEPLRRLLNDPQRFGFEGPERFVRRIEIQSLGSPISHSERAPIHPIIVPETHRGGARARATTRSADAAPLPRRGPPGPGESDADLLARALRRAGNVPVFQSEELVIEELVRPIYPEEARQRDIEGRVAVLARVDTVGQVVDVEVMNGEAEGYLERAAAEAVWRCRFRPYRIGGVVSEVYALFRFNFRLH